ncbi:hypothetical protein ADT37_21235, partial [Yersinia pestis subsp. microtus bv. Caucasica]
SFSFINSDQLQRFAKQIMSNAAGYFFDLALQTTVPEIKTAKDGSTGNRQAVSGRAESDILRPHIDGTGIHPRPHGGQIVYVGA